MNSKKNGFTLVELIAVIAIIGILVGLTIPAYFNIANNAKNNEYQSKKKFIEDSAVKYIQEFNSSSSLVFTVGRLVSAGYVNADKYKKYGDLEVPFVINPTDPEDNLACRTITITMDNFEYSATMSEEKDPECSLITKDVKTDNMGIKAYGLDNNKVTGSIDWKVKNEELKWTNKDVAIIVSPKYDDVKSISITYNGNTSNIDYDSSFCESLNDGATVNDRTCKNMVIIRGKNVLKTNVAISVTAGNEVNASNVVVKIDKEAPVATAEVYDGGSNSGKQAVAYLSDGNGSGGKGIYITLHDNKDEISEDNFFTAGNQGVVIIDHGIGNTSTIKSGTYYMWAKDNIGNVSSVSKVLEIKNVIAAADLGNIAITSKNSSYHSVNAIVTLNVTDTETGIVSACISNSSSSCEAGDSSFSSGWLSLTNNKITKEVTYSESEGSGLTKNSYGYVKDNLDNITQIGAASYKLYKSCSSITYTDGTHAYDKFISGVRCEENDVDTNLNSITVTPTRTIYAVGEDFSFVGNILASYKNGSSLNVDSGYAIDFPDMSTPGTKTVTITYKGQTKSFTITVKNITGISVSNAKTAYNVGDRFEFDGKVYANFSDGTSEEVISGYTASTPDMTTSGSKVITVTFQDYSTTYNITVSGNTSTLSRIEVADQTTTYRINATYSFDGKVYAYYSSGDSVELSAGEYSVSSPNMTTTGTKSVTVTYNGKSTSFNITVSGATSLEITNVSPTTYYIGDTFNSTMTVKAVYVDGSKDTLSSGSYTVSSPNMSTSGTKTVTVTYGSVTGTFSITVYGVKTLTLSGQTTSYHVGDSFSFNGTVTAVYDDDTSRTVASGSYTVSNTPNMSSAGTTQVSVTYKNKTATYNVTVYGVTGLEITNVSPTTYYIGDTFNSTMTVKKVYGDGYKDTLSSSSYTVSSPNMSTSGTKTVTVTYGSVTGTFDITVYGVKTLTLSGQTTSYHVGDSFSFNGTVTAVYDDDTNEVVASNKYTVSNTPNMSSAGTTQVSVTYKNKTATYNVTVYGVTGLDISGNKTSYLLGESFSSTMTVKKVYGDGDTVTLSSSDYTISSPNMSTSGTKTVTVTYGSVTGTFDITIHPITQITASGAASSFYVGDTFNYTGLVVTARYDNGATKTVTGYTVSTPDMSTAGSKTVTVTYSGFTATYTITVEQQTPAETFPKVFEIIGPCYFNGKSGDTADNITGNNCKDSNGTSYTNAKYINTGISLFTTENFSKDFEIYFEVDEFVAANQPATQSTIMNTKYEGGKYPGACVRRSGNNIDLTQKYNNGQASNPSSNTILASNCKQVRYVKKTDEDGVVRTYYSYNGAALKSIQEIQSTSEKFDLPVWFGASPGNAAGTTQRRYIKATLKNMYIKLGRYHD